MQEYTLHYKFSCEQKTRDAFIKFNCYNDDRIKDLLPVFKDVFKNDKIVEIYNSETKKILYKEEDE